MKKNKIMTLVFQRKLKRIRTFRAHFNHKLNALIQDPKWTDFCFDHFRWRCDEKRSIPFLRRCSKSAARDAAAFTPTSFSTDCTFTDSRFTNESFTKLPAYMVRVSSKKRFLFLFSLFFFFLCLASPHSKIVLVAAR